MRTRLIKGAMGVALAGAMLYGWSLTTAPATASVTPTPTVAATEAWYTLPACDEDAPDPSTTVPCVWNDEDMFWVMDGKGGAIDYPRCPTEDSPNCVWDALEQGDGRYTANRFLVNLSERD
jgi:hypothetical protein